MMDQSKLISGLIAKLRLAYPYYFKDLDEDLILGLVSMFQEQLGGYHPQVLSKAISRIITRSKFMPSIAEILEECDSCIGGYQNSILVKMKEDGYFKRGSYGDLDDEQAFRNYDKACSFVSRGIIPEWLKEDMKEYGYQEEVMRITNSNDGLLLLGGK